MADVTCPGCGTVRHMDQFRRDSSEFCGVCDYPLFWVRTTAFGDTSGDRDGDAGLRRLPGTAGRVAVASLVCPSCTEPNLVTAVNCIRCGADLHPKPVAPPPPPPPEPEPEPEPVVEVHRRWWPWVLLAVLVVTAVVVAAFFLL